MGTVRIFNLLTVCIFYTNCDPSEVLSDEMCFLFSIAQCILRDGSTLSLDIILIWCLWPCLSLLHPSTHQAVILCPNNAFQQPFRGSHVRVLRLHVSLWISNGSEGDRHNPAVYNPHCWLCFIFCSSWCWFRPGCTSVIMWETLPSQACWSLQTGRCFTSEVLPGTTFYVPLRVIERCPSHRPSMLHLQLYYCWCKRKAHL